MKNLRALVTLALGLGLTVALLWTLRGPSVPALAGCELAPTPPSLNRLPLAPKN